MSVWQSGLSGRIVFCGYWPQRQMHFASSMVAKAASRNEPFGISENGVIANTASEGGPTLLSEIHCVI